MKGHLRAGSPGYAAWLLGVILFLGSGYFYQDPEWNGNSRLGLIRAVVERGTLQIDAFHDAPGWTTGDKAFFNGHYYSDKAIGASLLGLPVYFGLHQVGFMLHLPLAPETSKHVLTTAVMATSFTVMGLAAYSIARRISRNPWKSLLATLTLCFGTMLWPYSAVFYGHLPAACFLILTFAILMRLGSDEEADMSRLWFYAGLAAGMAFLSDYTSALILAGLGAYGVHVLRAHDIGGKIRTAWPAIPGLLIPLALLFAYNVAIFGRPLEFGYAYEVEEKFQEIMGVGIMGIRLPALGAAYHISLDPKFGLFWLSPVLLLAPVGFVQALRADDHRAESLLSAYAFASMFLMNASHVGWWAGSTFGPRYLLPALPFFIVPLAALPDRLSKIFYVLGLLSVANMLIPLLGQIQFTRLEFKSDRGGYFVGGAPFHGFSILHEYGVPQISRQLEAGRPAWTLGSAIGLPFWPGAAALFAIEAALIMVWRRLLTRELASAHVE